MLDYYLLAGVGVALVLILLLRLFVRDPQASQQPSPANMQIPADDITATVIDKVKPAPGDIDLEVRMLIDYGNKIEAIRVVREKLGLDLKDAKDLVDAMERGSPIPLAAGNPAAHQRDGTDQELRQLVNAGQLIEAIKLAREQKGLDLKAAKAYVERL